MFRYSTRRTLKNKRLTVTFGVRAVLPFTSSQVSGSDSCQSVYTGQALWFSIRIENRFRVLLLQQGVTSLEVLAAKSNPRNRKSKMKKDSDLSHAFLRENATAMFVLVGLINRPLGSQELRIVYREF